MKNYKRNILNLLRKFAAAPDTCNIVHNLSWKVAIAAKANWGMCTLRNGWVFAEHHLIVFVSSSQVKLSARSMYYNHTNILNISIYFHN
jgi:hypothetical protein